MPSEVCPPGVLARCVSAILRPRPRGKDLHCPRFTNGINKAEDSEQLAGDEGGSYLATERGMANKGYGANMFARVGPQGGQQLVEETLEILNAMKAKDEA